MNLSRPAAYAVTAALLAAAIAALRLSPPPVIDDRLGIRAELPAQAGSWRGEDVWFCHNEPCAGRAFRPGELRAPGVCPVCGGKLYTNSLAEERLLPADTRLVRRRYVAPGGEQFFVSIVISGAERQSIHRPQVCLVSQGNTIVDQRVLPVPVPGRPPLEVMLLDLSPASAAAGAPSCYAYWFVTQGRETPSQLKRLAWMAYDSIVRNTRRRWAYITVSAARDPESGAHAARVAEFLSRLYPTLAE